MSGIIVISSIEIDDDTGKRHLVSSHGIDRSTGKVVILPNEHPKALGAVFDPEINEYVLAYKASCEAGR